VADIDMRAKHGLSREQAQQAADELAADLAEKFQIDYGWDGDDIHFERLGVDGMITVNDKIIHIKARLGLLLSFLAPRIEDEIRSYLTSHFGCKFF
jgi:putative polyhydroxyalkanoate system protein